MIPRSYLATIGVLLSAACFPSWAGEPYLVKDINPNGPSQPRLLTAVNGKLFFIPDDESHGTALRISDSTYPGTRIVKEIVPGPGTEQPGSLTAGSSAKNTQGVIRTGDRG